MYDICSGQKMKIQKGNNKTLKHFRWKWNAMFLGIPYGVSAKQLGWLEWLQFMGIITDQALAWFWYVINTMPARAIDYRIHYENRDITVWWVCWCILHLTQEIPLCIRNIYSHDDVIKWKQFPRYRPFLWGIEWSPVNSPHKGKWRRALMFSLICAWINSWVNIRQSGDLRRHQAHYDVIVMTWHVHGS